MRPASGLSVGDPVRDTPCTMTEESTTPDRLELVRRALEAGNSADFDETMSIYSSDVVWDATGIGLFIYKGRPAVREWLAEWRSSFEEPRSVAEEMIDFGHGITLGVFSTTGLLKGTSDELRVRWAAVAEWTDGLVKRVAVFSDINEARAAAERLAESRG